MDVEGSHIAADGGVVTLAGAMEILVAVAAPERFHTAHPELVCIGAEDVNPPTEPELDFESVSIEHNDLEWGQDEVGGKQEDGAALRMAYDDEANGT